jgi:hypothetical protein
VTDALTRTEERRAAVYALLGSLNELYPGPRTWTGSLVASSSKRGEVASQRVECQRCRGEGRVKRGTWFNCLTCGGSNVPGEARLGRGWLDVDAYTLAEVGSDRTGATTPRREVRCDVCGGWGKRSAYSREKPSRYAPLCEPCGGTGWVPMPVTIAPPGFSGKGSGAEHWVDAVKRRQDRLDERGSYRELRLALAWLERQDERRFRALWRLVVCEPWIERTAATQRWLDRIVDTRRALDSRRHPRALRHRSSSAQRRSASSVVPQRLRSFAVSPGGPSAGAIYARPPGLAACALRLEVVPRPCLGHARREGEGHGGSCDSGPLPRLRLDVAGEAMTASTGSRDERAQSPLRLHCPLAATGGRAPPGLARAARKKEGRSGTEERKPRSVAARPAARELATSTRRYGPCRGRPRRSARQPRSSLRPCTRKVPCSTSGLA